VCPSHALSLKNGKAVVVAPLACDYPGMCEMVCPVQAISRPFQIIYSRERKNTMSNHYIPDWRSKVVFAEGGPQPTPLLAAEQHKIVLAGLLPGQREFRRERLTAMLIPAIVNLNLYL